MTYGKNVCNVMLGPWVETLGSNVINCLSLSISLPLFLPPSLSPTLLTPFLLPSFLPPSLTSLTELLVYSVTFDVQELSLNCLIVFCRLLSSCQTEPSSDSSLPSSSPLGSSPLSLPSFKVSPPVSSTSLLLVINSDAVKELSLTLLEKYETKGGEDWGLHVVRDLSWSGLCLLLASSKRAKGVMMEGKYM